MITNSKIKDCILNAIDACKKINLPTSPKASRSIHTLSMLWNLAIDEGDDAERINLATRLINEIGTGL